VIAISDAHTGNVVSVLHQLPWDGMEPTGLNIDSAGELWITLSTGPRCSSDINGCGPLPGTCRSEILVANPATGAVRTVLQGGDNELISDAVPSSDGRRVAFLHSGCADFFFTNDLVVRDVSTGQQTVIGGDLPPCHVLAQPHWSTDSSRLAVVYGPASTAPSPGAGYGSCSAPLPSSLVLVSASASQPTITGRTAPADPGCDTQTGVPTANGYVAIEHCGSAPSFIDGTVEMVSYNDNFKAVARTPLGPCEDGASLAVDRTGQDVLVSTYQYCNPPGTTQPRTVVTRIEHGNIAAVDTQVGDELMVDQLAW
jgi:hypothetical protein